jgi:hypothetical protein
MMTSLNVMGSDPPVWISTFPDVTYQSNTFGHAIVDVGDYRSRDIDMIATTLVMVQLLSKRTRLVGTGNSRTGVGGHIGERCGHGRLLLVEIPCTQ